MNKWIPLSIGGFFVLLSFQNCSQSGSSAGVDTNTPRQSKIEDPDLKQAQNIDILTLDDSIKINLDLSSGRLTQMNLTTGQSVVKCLSSSMVGTINDLMNASSLCESKPPVTGEDIACAQVYGYPYAQLNWSDKSQKVGEYTDSCNRGPDLCGQDGNILRGLLRDVVARWDEWSCDFEEVSINIQD